jgi:hypothetical protein
MNLSTSGGSSAPGFSDPSFATSLLSSADMNDPLVQAALAQMQQQDPNQPPPAPGSGDGKAPQDEAGKKRKGDDV